MIRLSLSLTLFLLLLPAAVFAHGDPPEGESIYAVDDGWVYVTNFGVMTSDWPTEYVCEEAFFAHDDFWVAPFETHVWATFSRSAAGTTTDACAFDRRDELDDSPDAVAHRPDSGEVAWAQTADDGIELWYSDDRGGGYDEVAADLGGLRVDGLGFLGDSELVVVANHADEEIRGRAVLMRIDAHTGDRTDYDLDEDLEFPGLLDARSGQMLWYARRDGTTEIYWTDGDEVESPVFEFDRWPVSGALSPDGSRAYLGGVDDDRRGVFRADESDPAVWDELVAGHRALCLASTGDELLVCGHRRDDGHDLAAVDAAGDVTELVDFRDLDGYKSGCADGTDTATACPAVWPDIATALDIDIDEDDSSETDGDEEAGACSATGTGPVGLLIVVALLSLKTRFET